MWLHVKVLCWLYGSRGFRAKYGIGFDGWLVDSPSPRLLWLLGHMFWEMRRNCYRRFQSLRICYTLLLWIYRFEAKCVQHAAAPWAIKLAGLSRVGKTYLEPVSTVHPKFKQRCRDVRSRGERIIRYSNIIRILEAEYLYSYSYSGDFLKSNIIRIRIRVTFWNRILFVFLFGRFFIT